MRQHSANIPPRFFMRAPFCPLQADNKPVYGRNFQQIRFFPRKHNIWYYTTRGGIPQVVFGGKEIFCIRQIPAKYVAAGRYTRRQRVTAAPIVPQRLRIFAEGPLLPRQSLPRAAGRSTEERSMDYQKEYASLVGQVDRAISLLEHYAPGDPIVRKVGDLLLTALREAEEHYMQAAEEAEQLNQIGA